MTTELLNNDNIVGVGGEEPKYSDKNLSQCYFVHHKYHKDWPKPGVRAKRPATDRLVHDTTWEETVDGVDVRTAKG